MRLQSGYRHFHWPKHTHSSSNDDHQRYLYDPFFSILRKKVIFLNDQALLQSITQLVVSSYTLVIFFEFLANLFFGSIQFTTNLNDSFLNSHPQKSNQQEEKPELDELDVQLVSIFLGILTTVPSFSMSLGIIFSGPDHLVSKGFLPPHLKLHHILPQPSVLKLVKWYIVAVVAIFLIILFLPLAISAIHFSTKILLSYASQKDGQN